MESLGNNPSWTLSLAAVACMAIILGPSLSHAAVVTPIIQPTQTLTTPAQIAPSATRAVTATLSADAMFAFGSSTLSPAGRASLANLFDSLGGTRQISQLSVVGHSDPIGGAAYNRRLSGERASAVKAFFIEQGVPSTAIDASGVGDANPVTNSCPRAQTPEAIKCHGPDRRVELRAIVRASTPMGTANSSTTGFIDLRAQPAAAAAGNATGIQIAAKQATAPTIEPSLAPVTPPMPGIPPDVASPQQPPIATLSSAPPKHLSADTHPATSGSLAQVELSRSPSADTEPVVTPVVAENKLEQCELKAGLPLEDQIVGCATKAHWSVLWNIPGNWAAPNDATYTGNFEQVATQFFNQMAENGADIWVDVWEGNNTIIVTPTGAQGVEQ